MSREYEGQNPIDLAYKAESDLGTEAARKGHDASISANVARGASDSTMESGVDEAVTKKFPGAGVIYGSAASGAGNNREIALEEGGDINPKTGKLYKARDFGGGVGGPEDHERTYAATHGGEDNVRGNIRQGGGAK